MATLITTKTVDGICAHCDAGGKKLVSLIECDSPHAGKVYCCKGCVAGGISATARTIAALVRVVETEGNPPELIETATSMIPNLRRLYRDLLYFSLLEEEKEESERGN